MSCIKYMIWISGTAIVTPDGITMFISNIECSSCLTNILSRVGCIARQITSHLIWYSEFIAHLLLQIYNSQLHHYCHLQYHNYIFWCSPFHSLSATQVVAAGLQFILGTGYWILAQSSLVAGSLITHSIITHWIRRPLQFNCLLRLLHLNWLVRQCSSLINPQSDNGKMACFLVA
jgi:hypothetical protein